MLLTLATRSFSRKISANGQSALGLLDLPDYAIRQLDLRGLNVAASMLAGWSLDQFDRLRDRADKAACPCLVLIEDSPLPLVAGPKKRQAALERINALAVAANRLGCNALALHIEAPDTDEAFDMVAEQIRAAMPGIERMELQVLIAPGEGLTFKPDRLTELIKRIGGFRIGSLPSFMHAARTGDPVDALRKLAPYAGAIHATVAGFGKKNDHEGYDLTECVHAIRSVGFLNTLAIDYIGTKDPEANVEQAREILQLAIDAEMD